MYAAPDSSTAFEGVLLSRDDGSFRLANRAATVLRDSPSLDSYRTGPYCGRAHHDKGTAGESRRRKATGPRLLRNAAPKRYEGPTTAELPTGSLASAVLPNS
jgi:hypothetical protein